MIWLIKIRGLDSFHSGCTTPKGVPPPRQILEKQAEKAARRLWVQRGRSAELEKGGGGEWYYYEDGAKRVCVDQFAGKTPWQVGDDEHAFGEPRAEEKDAGEASEASESGAGGAVEGQSGEAKESGEAAEAQSDADAAKEAVRGADEEGHRGRREAVARGDREDVLLADVERALVDEPRVALDLHPGEPRPPVDPVRPSRKRSPVTTARSPHHRPPPTRRPGPASNHAARRPCTVAA